MNKSSQVKGYSGLVRETPADFSVHASVYTDPDVFDTEMRNIFERGWCYVAHESEIVNPGDFRTAAIGRVPVIVSRGDDQKVYVNINACRHRGTVVCREERGNTRFFVCPYHGWSYKRDGSLNNITDRDNFPDGWGADIKGLVAAAGVATYKGMIFASLNDDAPPFEQYFGPVKKYVDYWFDHALAGTVSLHKPWRASYSGNWKFQLENSTDGWHARYVHVSAIKTMSQFGSYNPRVGWNGCTRGFAGGHATLERPRIDIPPDLQGEFAEYAQVLERHYGSEQGKELFVRRHITLFPNLQLMEFKLRVIQPVSVNQTIVYEYPVDLQGTPEHINRAIRTRLLKEVSISSGSPVSGMVNADDVEIFARSQAGLAGGKMEWVRFARGIHRETVHDDKERSGADMDELPQRALYREWARRMQ
jgi:benzoate/toluate 1,2-dioxygenase alpha subunit